MSLWLLIDGYNVVSPIAPPGRSSIARADRSGRALSGGRSSDPMWLHRERMSLLDRLAKHLPPTVRERTCVVFDAKNPPPGREHQFLHHSIQVRFAVNYPEADDLIEELISAQSAPKSLMVVSSDRRIQVAASRRGATAMESDPWFDGLLDGRVRLAVPWPPTASAADGSRVEDPESKTSSKPQRPEADEVSDWMRQFGFEDESGDSSS